MKPTVTCNFQGRLGNLLYEIANTLATGWRNNAAITFCTEHEARYYNDFKFYTDYVRHIIQDYPLIETVPANFVIEEENVREKPKPFVITQDTKLNGYWTSPIYFSDFQERIIDLFTRQYKAAVDDAFKHYRSKSSQKICAVHLRRGDYVNEYGWWIGTEYYERAAKLMEQTLGDCNYLIFSDEPEWCMDNLPFMKWKMPARQQDYIEMQLMGKFDGLVIANSTFSAWGAMLSKQKLVVAPDVWRDTKGGVDPYNEWIYENHWVRL